MAISLAIKCKSGKAQSYSGARLLIEYYRQNSLVVNAQKTEYIYRDKNNYMVELTIMHNKRSVIEGKNLMKVSGINKWIYGQKRSKSKMKQYTKQLKCPYQTKKIIKASAKFIQMIIPGLRAGVNTKSCN